MPHPLHHIQLAIEPILSLNPLLSYQTSYPCDNSIAFKILLLNSRITLLVSTSETTPQSYLEIATGDSRANLSRQPSLLLSRHRTASTLLHNLNLSLPRPQDLTEPLRNLQKTMHLPDHIQHTLFRQLYLLATLQNPASPV